MMAKFVKSFECIANELGILILKGEHFTELVHHAVKHCNSNLLWIYI